MKAEAIAKGMRLAVRGEEKQEHCCRHEGLLGMTRVVSTQAETQSVSQVFSKVAVDFTIPFS